MTKSKNGKIDYWYLDTRFQDHLTSFTKALFFNVPDKYTVTVAAGEDSYQDYSNKRIVVGCGLFPKSPVEIQRRATLGLAAHEVGHVLYSGAMNLSGRHHQMWNYLEDQREEWLMGIAFPGVIPGFKLLARLVWAKWKKDTQPSPTDPAEIVYTACLAFRFARNARKSEKLMKKMLGWQPGCDPLWAQVKPLVFQAWRADTPQIVADIAKQILDILGIKSSAPKTSDGPKMPNRGDGTGGKSMPNPGGPVGSTQVQRDTVIAGQNKKGTIEAEEEKAAAGAGKDMSSKPDESGAEKNQAETVDDDTGADERADGQEATSSVNDRQGMNDGASKPADYRELEARMLPAARELARELLVRAPLVVPMANPVSGRYNPRSDMLTEGELPFVKKLLSGKDPTGLAMAIILDRSSSMSYWREKVKETAMMFYLASIMTQPRIPTWWASTGSGWTPWLSDITEEDDWYIKGMIAGFTTPTGTTVIDAMTEGVKQLSRYPQRTCIELVIHDGQPGEREEKLATALSHQAARRNIFPVGIYLGTDHDDITTLTRMFPYGLITCNSPDQIRGKLTKLLTRLVKSA